MSRRADGALPADHPAHSLGPTDEGDRLWLDVTAASGRRDEEAPSAAFWHAGAFVRSDVTDAPLRRVARMDLTVVNDQLGNPIVDLDAIGQDAHELSSSLWDGGGNTSEAFNRVVTDTDYDVVFGPVLLVDTFEVDRDWRGSAVTPLLALRMLEIFAHLGLEAAALTAAPVGARNLPEAEHRRVQALIQTMWERVGFVSLGGPDTTMAMRLDPRRLRDRIEELAGDDPVLAEIGDSSMVGGFLHPPSVEEPDGETGNESEGESEGGAEPAEQPSSPQADLDLDEDAMFERISTDLITRGEHRVRIPAQDGERLAARIRSLGRRAGRQRGVPVRTFLAPPKDDGSRVVLIVNAAPVNDEMLNQARRLLDQADHDQADNGDSSQ